jgi:hypothetical protein
MKRIFEKIERWGSASDDRVKLLIIMVWAAFGVLVVLSTLIVAWILLPHDFTPF